ncbi:Resolvase domain protein [Candidatus Glomeribacter gigasporarum BEG34]|uniref:Resolvase domain protein n=2 Tax=Candidatus Glomeribacter gigasporarum TaxID=132144 RepID=G2JAU6_9BURK|nr:IS110 family transposase [Candidatus Glomeribacter gigasporarum]CCD29898.1 Resolvase domain protein [Candidatus Glomeribacter gigasporarum BEG34]
MITKITEQHYSKPAYIYIRQSTPAQVRHHQESTERQYALRDKALALGWPETAIRTLDRDLGQSGARMKGREDFKTLVADVSMGQVGAVFALEVSRLARSNLDWHRLLELCALTHTLVIDADGCYDPGDFNDGLLLGLKGTMAQAKLHFLRGRLQGGKLNKAQKGELRFPLPVGLCYDDEGRIVLDPNDEVRGAVQWVFRLFQKTGSAYAVVKRFTQSGLRFPKRAYGGAWAGQLIWGRLIKRREQRVKDLQRDKNHLEHCTDTVIKRSLKAHIRWLDKEIGNVETAIEKQPKTAEMQETHALLTSVPGVGNLTAWHLEAFLPELGRCAHQSLAALVGGAPFNHDSGKHQGERFMQGGRARVRRVLYMAALSAARCNEDMKTFYERLRAAGKPIKALIAVLRKLLSILNSLVQRRSPWQENPAPTT